MDLQELRQEAIKIIKANPELKSEIQDLFSLAISEVEEGGSESHECDLAYNDMIELQNEANNNKMVKGGNLDSKSLFDLEYGDIFKIDRNPERPHTMTGQHFLFIGFSEKYAKPEGVTIEAAYFPGSFYGPNYDQYKEHSYLSGLKNGDITIISKEEAGEMLLDYYIRNDKFKNGGKLTGPQQAKFDKVMSEWKAGKLHSGSSDGPIVTDQDQAIAIAYAQANGMKKMEFGGLVYDSLSDEAKDRMDGLVPTEQINNVLSNCRYIVSQMMEEGFELDEAISFIVYKIVDDFTDKRMGYFSDEYYPEDWKSKPDKPKVLVKLYNALSKADNLDYLSMEYDEDEGYYIDYTSGLESESEYHKGEIESYAFYVDQNDDSLIESVYDLNGHSATGLTIDQVLNAARANNKMDQGGSVEDDQIEEYAEAIYEDLRQEYKPWELQNMSMEEAMMSVDSYDEVPENLKEEVASYLMNMASQNEFFEEDEEDEEYKDGGPVQSKEEKMIASKAKAIFRDLKRDGYDNFDLAMMTEEEANETVSTFSDVPDNLKKEVADYLFMMCQRIFGQGGSMYNKGGVIENKMQSLENELKGLESEIKWTQQQNGASKQYYLRKRRSGKMTRERAMELIDQSNASWKKEREKVREKIKEVKDRIKRLEELSSKVNADQFAHGGGVGEVIYQDKTIKVIKPFRGEPKEYKEFKVIANGETYYCDVFVNGTAPEKYENRLERVFRKLYPKIWKEYDEDYAYGGKMETGGGVDDVSFSSRAVEKANLEQLFDMAKELGMSNYQNLNKEILRNTILEHFKLTRFKGDEKGMKMLGNKYRKTEKVTNAYEKFKEYMVILNKSKSKYSRIMPYLNMNGVVISYKSESGKNIALITYMPVLELFTRKGSISPTVKNLLPKEVKSDLNSYTTNYFFDSDHLELADDIKILNSKGELIKEFKNNRSYNKMATGGGVDGDQ